MKKIYQLLMPLSLLLLGMVFYACHKEDVQPEGIYITGAQVGVLKTLGVDNTVASLDISATSSIIADQDITVNFSIDPDAIDAFNKKNGTTFKVLPASFSSLSATTAVLKKGGTVSDLIKLNIKPLDATVSPDFSYLVPVTLTSSSAGAPILNASKTIFVKISRTITAPALRLSKDLSFAVPTPLNITSYTVEMRINADALTTNNQALFYSYDTEIYSRFGDVVIKTNQLQVKTAGKIQPNSNTLFQSKRWYHIAFVFDAKSLTFSIYVDGALDSSVPVPPGVTFNVSSMGFSSGFKGLVNEVRFWQIARTQAEIANNMCSLNPATAGLIGYWKMDEGQGNTIKDYSGNNHTGTTTGATWAVDGSKCAQ